MYHGQEEIDTPWEERRLLTSRVMEDPRRSRSQPAVSVHGIDIEMSDATLYPHAAATRSDTELQWRRNSYAETMAMLPSRRVCHSDTGLTLSRSLTSKRSKQRMGTTSLERSNGIRIRRSRSTRHVSPNVYARRKSAVYLHNENLIEGIERLEYEDMTDSTTMGAELSSVSCHELYKRQQSIREMPANLTIKKRYRYLLMSHRAESATDWSHGFTNNVHKSWDSFKIHVRDVLAYCEIWAGNFRHIEGNFGTAILSYFRFVRWLMFLNLLIMLIMLCVTTIPFLIYSPPDTFEEYIIEINTATSLEDAAVPISNYTEIAVACSAMYVDSVSSIHAKREGIDHFLDFLQGTGFMERTILFYGMYFNKTHASTDVTGTEELEVYNMSLAYMLATGFYFLISFLLIVKGSAAGVKEGLVSQESMTVMYCNKVFGGWDYCISNLNAAKLKYKNIHHELKVDLDEQEREILRRNRKSLDWLKLFVIRVLINFLVIILLVGSLTLIFFTNDWSLKLLQDPDIKSEEILSLLVQFLPSISITLLNLLLPQIFNIMVVAESYSPSFQVYITLIRIVLLRLASIGILMLSLYIQLVDKTIANNFIFSGIDEFACSRNDTASQAICDASQTETTMSCGNKDFDQVKCWETYVGQQIYKLVLLDFIVVLLVTFCVEFPRKIIHKRFHVRFKLIKLVGQQEFDLPKNVLDIVYSQTLCWLGAFFSPLIPLMCMLKCMLFFYVKKLTLLRNCLPPQRPYRASKSNSFFMSILLLSFLLSALPVGYMVGRIPPSQSCGPFRVYSHQNFTMFTTITNTITQWPDTIRDIMFFFGSSTFYVPAIVILCLVMYYFWALAQGHKSMSKLLKKQLAIEGKDKQFLLNRVQDVKRRLPRFNS